MPRATTRAARPSSEASAGGTSGASASCRSRSISLRSARIRSPSWPPNDSSTIPAQSSSPEAQRNTDGMKPVDTPTGMGGGGGGGGSRAGGGGWGGREGGGG